MICFSFKSIEFAHRKEWRADSSHAFGLWTLRDSTTSWLDTSRLLLIFGFGYFETHVWTPRDYWFWTLRDCFSLEVTKMKILRNSNILLLFNLIEIFFRQAFYHYSDILRISRNYIILSQTFQTNIDILL